MITGVVTIQRHLVTMSEKENFSSLSIDSGANFNLCIPAALDGFLNPACIGLAGPKNPLEIHRDISSAQLGSVGHAIPGVKGHSTGLGKPERTFQAFLQ